MSESININDLLQIANDILYEEELSPIDLDDNLKTCGFSSMNMLMFILRIEKTGLTISHIDAASIVSVRDLHQKIENKTGGRKII